MDEMRAMLDSLMGKDRNAPVSSRRKVNFYDSDVCKFYLLDFCPHELFPNTKSDIGPCNKTHSDGLKTAFESHSESEYYRAKYEEEFVVVLQKLVDQVEQKIQRGEERIKAPAPKGEMTEDIRKKIDSVNAQISTLLKKAEAAGAEGNIDEASELSDQVARLRGEKERLESHPFDDLVQKESQLRVCSICGAMQSVGDAASRFESHISGKQHVGFERIRNALIALKEKKQQRETILSQGFSGSKENCQAGEANGAKDVDVKKRSRRDGDEREKRERESYYSRNRREEPSDQSRKRERSLSRTRSRSRGRDVRRHEDKYQDYDRGSYRTHQRSRYSSRHERSRTPERSRRRSSNRSRSRDQESQDRRHRSRKDKHRSRRSHSSSD